MGDRMGSSPIDRTNRKDDNAIVFFSFSAKNYAALPLISKKSFQARLKDKKIDSLMLSIFNVFDYLYYAVIRIYVVGKFFLIILISALYSWFTM